MLTPVELTDNVGGAAGAPGVETRAGPCFGGEANRTGTGSSAGTAGDHVLRTIMVAASAVNLIGGTRAPLSDSTGRKVISERSKRS